MAATEMKRAQSAKVREPQNLEGEIRQRAYELYESRGREDGRDLDDWLQAESEIRTTGRKAAA